LSIDVPPYTLAEGFPARIRGLNLEGLRRLDAGDEVVTALKEVYRMLFRKEDLTHTQAYEEIIKRGLNKHPLVEEFVRFVQDTDRGRHGRAQEGTRVEIPPEERDGTLGLRAGTIPGGQF
jgi:UDP-N-acetylglucosamine acyltransferase